MIVPQKMAGKERLPCPYLCDMSSFFPCIEKYVSHINSIRHFLYRKTVHGHQSSASCRLGIGRIYLPEDRPVMGPFIMQSVPIRGNHVGNLAQYVVGYPRLQLYSGFRLSVWEIAENSQAIPFSVPYRGRLLAGRGGLPHRSFVTCGQFSFAKRKKPEHSSGFLRTSL